MSDFVGPALLRSSWRPERLIVRGPLTDAMIEKYRQRGYYSAEFKRARREHMAKKAAKRNGNFVEVDGRPVYSPL